MNLGFNPSDWYPLIVAALGGIFVVIVTAAATRFGSVVGGVLGGLPLTGAWTVATIAANQGIDASPSELEGYLLGSSVWFSFMLAYALLSKIGFRVGLAVSLVYWGMATSLLAISGVHGFWDSISGGLVISAATLLVYFKAIKLEKHRAQNRTTRPSESAIRFVASSVIIFTAILLSRAVGPFFGGLIATAPLISTQIIYWTYKMEGIDFSRSITRSITLTATLTIFPYGVSVWWLYPLLGGALGAFPGVVGGTIVGYGIASIGAYTSYLILS